MCLHCLVEVVRYALGRYLRLLSNHVFAGKVSLVDREKHLSSASDSKHSLTHAHAIETSACHISHIWICINHEPIPAHILANGG